MLLLILFLIYVTKPCKDESSLQGFVTYNIKNNIINNINNTVVLCIWSNFVELKEQGVIITCLTEICYKTTTKEWHEIVLQMASNIVWLARRALGLVQTSNFSCAEPNANELKRRT